MINFISSKKIIGSLSVLILTTILAAGLLALFLTNDDNNIANAQVVDVDEPPTNATEELDVKVDATEPLPANGTLVVDISEADDIDIDAIPPLGVSIVVTNTTLTVTNNPVEITEGATTATQSDIAGPDTATPAGNNEDGGEESLDNDDDDAGDGGSGNDDEPASNTDSPDEEGEGE
jgi:hypothetical protein